MAPAEEVFMYRRLWNIFDRRTAKEHAAHLLPHLKPHFSILDMGCGRGSISMDLAKLVPEGTVLGTDVNPELIEGARGRAEAEERGSIKNLEFKVMDANDMHTFPSESFDVVHAHQVLLWLKDPVSVLKEIRRILKPGGILSTRDNVELLHFPVLPMMQKYIDHGRALMPNSQGLHFGHWNHLAAHEAGFAWENIEMSSWAWSIKVEERGDWAVGSKAGARPALLAAGLMTAEELDQVEKEFEEWAAKPEARCQILDGALICWK